jgi:hypothetical protein
MLLKTLLDPGSYQPPIHAMDTDMGYISGEFRGSEALLILVAKSLTGHRLSHEPRKP